MKGVKTRISVEDRGSAKLKRSARDVTKLGRTWQRTQRVTSRATRIMGRGFNRLGRVMGKMMRKAKFMVIGLQLTATIMAGSMVRSALKYERALRNVTSLMAGAGMGQEKLDRNFKRMDGSIRRIAVSLGQSPEDLAKGMYNVVSATFDGESALQVLEWSAKGAMAGLSDTETVTGLMTKTLQAYRKENETNTDVAAKSRDVMDTYFMAVNRGMFTFDELASKMGALPSTAAAFGVSLQDLMAFLSTATTRGVGLDEAITGVRQTLLQIAKETPATAKAAEEIFGKDWKQVWSAQGLAADGLYGTLSMLNEVLPAIPPNILEAAAAMEDEGGDAFAFIAQQTGKSVDAIAALFPNIRALKAVMAVSGPGMKLYGENMGFMAERVGATDRALQEMEKSGSLALDKFKSVLAVIGLDVGGLVLPALTQVGNSVVSWYSGMQMDFAKQGGLFKDDAWMEGIPDSQAEQQMKIAAGRFWDAADPLDRLSFTFDSAKQELGDWWGSDEVQGNIQTFTDTVQEKLTKALTGAWDGFLDYAKGKITEIPDRMKNTVVGQDGGYGGGNLGWAAAGLMIATSFVRKLPGAGLLAWIGRGLGAAGAGASGAATGAGASGAAAGAGGAAVSPALVGGAAVAGLAGLMAQAGVAGYAIGDRVTGGADRFLLSSIAGFLLSGAVGMPAAVAGAEFANANNQPGPGKTLDKGGYTSKNMTDAFERIDWSGYAASTETTAEKQTVAAIRMERSVARFGEFVGRLPGNIGLMTGVYEGATGGAGTVPGGQHPSARGFSGMVYSPKSFTVGEGNRPEHVQITPSNGGRGGGRSVVNHNMFNIDGARSPDEVAAVIVRKLEIAMGNG